MISETRAERVYLSNRCDEGRATECGGCRRKKRRRLRVEDWGKSVSQWFVHLGSAEWKIRLSDTAAARSGKNMTTAAQPVAVEEKVSKAPEGYMKVIKLRYVVPLIRLRVHCIYFHVPYIHACIQ